MLTLQVLHEHPQDLGLSGCALCCTFSSRSTEAGTGRVEGGKCRSTTYCVRRVGSPQVDVMGFPQCEQPPAQWTATPEAPIDPQLLTWLENSEASFSEAAQKMQRWHSSRVGALGAAASSARQNLWWPFTQHASVRNLGDQLPEVGLVNRPVVIHCCRPLLGLWLAILSSHIFIIIMLPPTTHSC